jgi:hypothetical protein
MPKEKNSNEVRWSREQTDWTGINQRYKKVKIYWTHNALSDTSDQDLKKDERHKIAVYNLRTRERQQPRANNKAEKSRQAHIRGEQPPK